MKILLDTHTFLWIAGDWNRIKPAARQILAKPETKLYLSIASIWEMSIKASLGRLHLPAAPPVFLSRRLADFGITALDITLPHALEVFSLERHHADPFDRMLVAQSKLEGLTLATHDRAFQSYGVDLLWS